jgi:Metal-dependent amidase/aminoacylase/carboxypeptidase
MPHEALYKRIDQLTSDFSFSQIQIFRWLHQHPELAYQEHETSQFIQKQLKKLPNLIVMQGIAKTGKKLFLMGKNQVQP